ncbi:MAG TPA: response regulator transcription factor [Pyrinomonadaceae bacterium]|nr:response regulator transcription factor [Pyrinomonadaceae bacterium]
MTRARILLADDHKEMRERVISLLQDEFEVVGAVGDGSALMEAELTMQPDVCVVDISMPGLCGIDAAAQLHARGSKTKVVVLTVYDDADFLEAALTSGALGYVVKSRMTSDLCLAIHEALAGRLFVSPSPRLNALRT